jgi:hypothetical protein
MGRPFLDRSLPAAFKVKFDGVTLNGDRARRHQPS